MGGNHLKKPSVIQKFPNLCQTWSLIFLLESILLVTYIFTYFFLDF